MTKFYKIIEIEDSKKTTLLKRLLKPEADEALDKLERLYPECKFKIKMHDADDEEVDESVTDDLDTDTDD